MLPFHRSVGAIIRRGRVRICVAAGNISGVVAASDRSIAVAKCLPSDRIKVDRFDTYDCNDDASISNIRTMNVCMVERTKKTASAKSCYSVIQDGSRINRYFVREIRRDVIAASQTPAKLA